MTRKTLNLDEAKAARAEVRKEAPSVTFGGVEYILPFELPLDFSRAIGKISKGELDEIDKVLGYLFGDSAETVATMMTDDDAKHLLQNLGELYGADLGESSASAS